MARPTCWPCPAYPGFAKLRPIPVPLQNGEPEPTLDLQAAFDLSYDWAAYQDSLDYSQPLQPSAGAEDADWLKAQLSPSV